MHTHDRMMSEQLNLLQTTFDVPPYIKEHGASLYNPTPELVITTKALVENMINVLLTTLPQCANF